MRKQFYIAVWRKFYDEAHGIAQILKDSQPDYDGNPPKFYLSPKAKKELEKDLDKKLKNCSAYMDECSYFAKPSRWTYKPKDPTTWISSKHFQFSHLLDLQDTMRIPNFAK